MSAVFTYREMTEAEYRREQEAFDKHGLEFNNPPERAERHTFVVTDSDTGKFIGCSSGLAQKTDRGYSGYFFLTDLLVEKEYRKNGYGKKLLQLLETKVKSLGISHIWTWTAGYEAPGFYEKQGYSVFTTFVKWYPSGHSRVGLIKDLSRDSNNSSS